MLAEVSREPVTTRLSLDGLNAPEVAQYVELAASEVTSPELVAELHADTEGNPLFVGEIVRLLAVEGVRPESRGERRLVIPQGVREVIARRLTHLSQQCNRVLVLAAVLGREFDHDVLAQMSGGSGDQLLDALDEAVAARVVSDVPGAPGRLRFDHVLIRDTLYDGLMSARRVHLHGLAVSAIEQLHGAAPGPQVAELARHSIAAGNQEKGVRYRGPRAGARVVRRGCRQLSGARHGQLGASGRCVGVSPSVALALTSFRAYDPRTAVGSLPATFQGGPLMARYETKIKEGAAPFLEQGEEVVAAVMARPRGWTQAGASAGGGVIPGLIGGAIGGKKQQKQADAAEEAGFELASPMALAVTQRRLLSLKVGSLIGMGMGGKVEGLVSAAPLSDVDSIEVKRLAAGKTITVTVRGVPFVLEVGAGANAKGVAEAFERAKAAAPS